MKKFLFIIINYLFQQVKKQSFSELLYGSPNWESKVKTTKCCFYLSDVLRCEQFELCLLNEEVRHKSRRARSGTGDSENICRFFQSCAHLATVEPWTHRICAAYIGWRGDDTYNKYCKCNYSKRYPERQIQSRLLYQLS